jgi:hypothetical protein
MEMHLLTPADWALEPDAQLALQSLNPADVQKYEPASVWNGLGVVALEYRGKTNDATDLLDRLRKMRTAAIDAGFGASFSKLKTTSACEAYIAFDEKHATVTAAIDAEFARRLAAKAAA